MNDSDIAEEDMELRIYTVKGSFGFNILLYKEEDTTVLEMEDDLNNRMDEYEIIDLIH